MIEYLTQLAADPAAWAALVTLIAMEVVLGIDNLIFISILTNKLPAEHRERARRIGIGCALAMRLLLLGTIAIIVQLTEPVIELFGHGLSWRDLILIAGGLGLGLALARDWARRFPDAWYVELQRSGHAEAEPQVRAAAALAARPSAAKRIALSPHSPPPGAT
jgi:predicted tellurium resistance membrane protein TerC